MQLNYAKLFGMDSVVAASIFAVLYVPLLAWFILQSIRRPTYVFVVLSIFCTIRVVAFAIRAVLANVESAGENLSLFIADEVLFGVGFFGLLYSAYTLVLDRDLLLDHTEGKSRWSDLKQRRRFFRIALVVAVALGITAVTETQSSDPKTLSRSSALTKASTVIFLVLTIVQVFLTVLYTKREISSSGRYKHDNESLGMRHGGLILCAIALFLLIRELFVTATLGARAKQQDEHLWYPLSALPEIVAVILYAIPGLVPPRSELSTHAIPLNNREALDA